MPFVTFLLKICNDYTISAIYFKFMTCWKHHQWLIITDFGAFVFSIDDFKNIYILVDTEILWNSYFVWNIMASDTCLPDR